MLPSLKSDNLPFKSGHPTSKATLDIEEEFSLFMEALLISVTHSSRVTQPARWEVLFSVKGLPLTPETLLISVTLHLGLEE